MGKLLTDVVMTGWVQTKLVRPVPRAKRLLADGETFGQLAEVLMFPSGELASAVLGLIFWLYLLRCTLGNRNKTYIGAVS